MKTTGYFLPLLLTASAFIPAANAQTITYTTTGVLSVISGPDKLGLNNTTFTVTNDLTTGQTPISGTSNQYSTTITATDPQKGFTSTAPATITINFGGSNSPSNSIGLTAVLTELGVSINVGSTVFVPSITGVSPAPIATTPLNTEDTLTLSAVTGETTYGFSSGTISSFPGIPGCTFSVTPGALSFPIGGGSKSLTVTASGSTCSWTASANQSWILLGTTAGNGSGTVLVTVPANTTGGSLSGTITIAGQSIPVTEDGPVICNFTVTPASIAFPHSGGSTPVTISATSASCAWTASSNQPWLSVGTTSGTGNGTVQVTALADSGAGTLNGTVTIAGQSIPVTESGILACTYALTPPSASLPSGGGTVTFTITTSDQSCAWTASSSASWAMVGAASGTGNGSIVVTAGADTGANAQAAILTVADQAAPLIESGTASLCAFAIAPTTLNFPATASNATVGVAATSPGCTWSVNTPPSWVNFDSKNGSGTGSIVVTPTLNNTNSVRTGTMTLAGLTVHLNQLTLAGCTFSVSPTTLNYGSSGGISNLTVTAAASNCIWTASSNQGWTSLSPTTGTGNGTVSVTALPNQTPSFRSGSVVVGAQPVSISQTGLSGCYFTVSPTALSFSSFGGINIVTVTASAQTCSWTAGSLATWITLSPSGGTGSGTVQITASANATGNNLSDSALIAGQTVSLSQAGVTQCSFQVDTSSLLFPSTGGSVSRSIVASDQSCPWTAVPSAPFITVSPTGGTGNGSILISVPSDLNAPGLSGSVAVAGQTIPVGETGGCSFTVSPASLAVDETGGASTITISGGTSSTCTWTASTNVSWATPSAGSGTGNGSLTITIPNNSSGADRAGTLSIAGLNIPVLQDFTTQTFGDVPPSAYFFDAVNIMASHNITAGCGGGNFCPGSSLTRAQMAIFIVRAAYGGDDFNSGSVPYFEDVQPDDFGFKWIQKLSELGITSGCGGSNFCPNDLVTRDQMAVFLIRGRLGSTTTFNYSPTPIFNDVPSVYWAFPWIQRMARDQITSGCAPGLYCPALTVSRGDTAILLVRAMFDQLLPATTPLITGISPVTLSAGQTQTFTITGVNTHFVQDTTTISPIPGVTIGAITVSNPTTVLVSLTAGATPPTQPNAVLVITGTEEAVLPNGLSVN